MSRHQDPSYHLKGFTVDAFSSIIFDSPDWPTCLMAITFLEKILENALNIRFDGRLTKTERSEMFSGHGPLSTLSQKILVGYGLGLFTREARNDLLKMKNIRNEAAHRINDFSFSIPDISIICNTLQLTRTLDRQEFNMSALAKEKWERLGFDSPRAKFTLSFFHIIVGVLLNTQIYTRHTLPAKRKLQIVIEELAAKANADLSSMLKNSSP
jgi:DNA-binding MltR family transcriptional regulator